MAKPDDILDPVLRNAMRHAEGLIEAGEYAKAARACADAYVRLLEERPELTPPSFFESAEDALAAEALAAPAGRRVIWPPLGGINVSVGHDRKPRLVFEKERFSMSEAVSYYEFLVQQIVDAERAAFAASTPQPSASGV